MRKRRYLFIGAHPDDLELCCGGYIVKLIEEGHDVICDTLSYEFDYGNIKHEWEISMTSLKVNANNKRCYNYTPRRFEEERQSILDYMIQKKKDYLPDVIVTHSSLDIHQDHATVGREAIRAFKNNSLITFAADWNHSGLFNKNFFVQLSDVDVQKKLTSLIFYKSQVGRRYFSNELLLSIMSVDGLRCGSKYAESFHIVNYIN